MLYGYVALLIHVIVPRLQENGKCCGTIVLYTVKICCSFCFNKELNGQSLMQKEVRQDL